MYERSNFNCLHVNNRSLIANLDPLTFLLNDLRERGIVIHTFAICETYLNDQNVQLAKLENYVPIHVCRKKRLGGGVSLFVHDSLKITSVIDTPFTESFESCGAVVDFFVCEYYRILNSPDSEFFSSLRKIAAMSSKFESSFLCTDKNYDLLKLHTHKPTHDCILRMHEN